MSLRQKTRLAFESLESRQLFSGNRASVPVMASDIAALTGSSASTLPAEVASTPAAAASASTRWDWLADTDWYVPVDNLLAYTCDPDLSDPTPVGDQTLWHIEQSTNGQIAGDAAVKLTTVPIPIQLTFTGVVTKGGQIRIEFSSGTTGIGQMRFVNGAWTMQMQMVTGTSSILTHWAFMTQGDPDTAPEPGDPSIDDELFSERWQWLEGTQWAITDKTLFGSKKAGIFTISEFHSGYFWGSGTSGKKPFNVLGSVTPEGNLLLVVSVNGAQPEARTGMLEKTPNGGVMTLRTYEGNPAVGFALSIEASTSGKNDLTSGVLAAMRGLSSAGQMSAKEVRAVAEALQRAGKMR
jgi:hypothetical protein